MFCLTTADKSKEQSLLQFLLLGPRGYMTNCLAFCYTLLVTVSAEAAVKRVISLANAQFVPRSKHTPLDYGHSVYTGCLENHFTECVLKESVGLWALHIGSTVPFRRSLFVK